LDTEKERSRKRALKKAFPCQFQFRELKFYRTRKKNRHGKEIHKSISVLVPIPCTKFIQDTEKERSRKRALKKAFPCQFQFRVLKFYGTQKKNGHGKGIQKSNSVSVPIP